MVSTHVRRQPWLIQQTNSKVQNPFAEANGKKVTLKSILGVLSLGLEQGDTISIIVEGEGEAEALQALTDVMVNEGLGEINA